PAFGLDVSSDPDRAAAISRALDTGRVSATAPLRLVQRSAGQLGILLVGAVQRGGDGPGAVVEVIRLAPFVEAALSPSGGPISLRLVDIAQRRALYDDFPAGANPAQFRQEFEFGQRRYELQTAPTAAYLARHTRWESLVLL